MMGTAQIGILYGVVTLVLLFSGMPIAFALGLSALGFMALGMTLLCLQIAVQIPAARFGVQRGAAKETE